MSEDGEKLWLPGRFFRARPATWPRRGWIDPTNSQVLRGRRRRNVVLLQQTAANQIVEKAKTAGIAIYHVSGGQ